MRGAADDTGEDSLDVLGANASCPGERFAPHAAGFGCLWHYVDTEADKAERAYDGREASG